MYFFPSKNLKISKNMIHYRDQYAWKYPKMLKSRNMFCHPFRLLCSVSVSGNRFQINLETEMMAFAVTQSRSKTNLKSIWKRQWWFLLVFQVFLFPETEFYGYFRPIFPVFSFPKPDFSGYLPEEEKEMKSSSSSSELCSWNRGGPDQFPVMTSFPA